MVSLLMITKIFWFHHQPGICGQQEKFSNAKSYKNSLGDHGAELHGA